MAKHRAIRDALLERIVTGAWPPGGAIPHEAELALEFGVTRPTISRALRDMVESGLIERRRRAGSRVAIRQSADTTLRIPLVREEIEGRGGRYGYLLLDLHTAAPPASVRAAFGLSAGQSALFLRSLHFDDGRAWQLEERWINLAVLPEAAGQDFATISANEWLVRRIPYTRAEHLMRAAAASEAEAALLHVPVASPLFLIERTTWSGNDALTHVRLAHPAETFRMVARSSL